MRNHSYRIVIRGELQDLLSREIAPACVERRTGQTEILTRSFDQSALYGLLDRLHASHLDLVSVQEVPG